MFIIVCAFISACYREPAALPAGNLQNKQLPELVCEIEMITITSVTVSGQFTKQGNLNIIHYGVVWDTFPSPTVAAANRIDLDSFPVSAFSKSINNLNEGTNYYLRAFVITVSDTLYSEEKSFRTKSVWEKLLPYPDGPCSGVGLFRVGDTAYVAAGFQNHTKFYALNPATNTWINKGVFPGSGKNVPASFSIGNIGYIGTGTTTNFTPVKTFWAFDVALQSFSQKAQFGGVAREAATGFSLNGKGYIGLGSNASGSLKDFWEYNPANNTWTKVTVDFPGTPRNTAISFIIGNKAYVGYGLNSEHDFWEFDPTQPNPWRELNSEPPGRYAGFGFSIGDKGYLMGGGNDLWEFDPNGGNNNLGAWKKLPDAPIALSFANAIGFDDFAIIIGGRNGTFGLQDEVWKFKVPN